MVFPTTDKTQPATDVRSQSQKRYKNIRTYLINISSHLPKESLFRRYTVSPPDKGDLGGFLHEKSLLDNTLKLFMRRTVVRQYAPSSIERYVYRNAPLPL